MGSVMSNTSPFIMTIDVEDWFNSSLDLFKEVDSSQPKKPEKSVVNNTLSCLEILKKYKNSATFFILTSICETFPDLIQEIRNSGHEIGVHGYRHRLIYKMSPNEFKQDLEKSLSLLHKTGIHEIKGYRAPYWSITKNSLWALDILKEFGLQYDSSIFPIKRELYGIPSAPTEPYEIKTGFWEFPPATFPLLGLNMPIAGGGYLRLTPYWLLTRLLKKFLIKKKHGIFYFHPYELDPTDIKPQVQLKSISSLLYFVQQFVGRKDNPEKLKRFLSDYSFTSIESQLNNLKRK